MEQVVVTTSDIVVAVVFFGIAVVGNIAAAIHFRKNPPTAEEMRQMMTMPRP